MGGVVILSIKKYGKDGNSKLQSVTLNVSLLAAHTDAGEPDVGESHDCRVTAREKKLIIVQLNDFGPAKL